MHIHTYSEQCMMGRQMKLGLLCQKRVHSHDARSPTFKAPFAQNKYPVAVTVTVTVTRSQHRCTFAQNKYPVTVTVTVTVTRSQHQCTFAHVHSTDARSHTFKALMHSTCIHIQSTRKGRQQTLHLWIEQRGDDVFLLVFSCIHTHLRMYAHTLQLCIEERCGGFSV